MNRREFIKGLFASAAIATVVPETFIDGILNESKGMDDHEFVTYVTIHMNMWVNNPAACVRITNIEVPENY